MCEIPKSGWRTYKGEGAYCQKCYIKKRSEARCIAYAKLTPEEKANRARRKRELRAERRKAIELAVEKALRK